MISFKRFSNKSHTHNANICTVPSGRASKYTRKTHLGCARLSTK